MIKALFLAIVWLVMIPVAFYFGRLVVKSFKDGIAPMRGNSYHREHQPALFYAVIAVWLIGAALALGFLGMGLHFFFCDFINICV